MVSGTAVLDLEVRAARLEALLDADPSLGAVWRRGVGLIECCRSIALEDIHIHEGDVALPDMRESALPAEAARGVLLASAVRTSLEGRNPFLDLGTAEEAASLGRLWRACAYDVEPEISLDGKPLPKDAPDLAGLAADLRVILSVPVTPLLGAISAARAMRAAAFSPAPLAERLAFILMEDVIRRKGVRRSDPRWCFTPSLALTTGGFRAWSLSSEAGVETLLTGLSRSLDEGLGRVPVLRRWIAICEKAGEHAHGRSRYPDMAGLIMAEPAVTIESVARRLRITWHGARNLVLRAEEEGLIISATYRKTWRVWVAAWMWEIIRGRGAPRPVRSFGTVEEPVREVTNATPVRKKRRTPGEADPAIMESLDAAMRDMDAVLEKYRKPS